MQPLEEKMEQQQEQLEQNEEMEQAQEQEQLEETLQDDAPEGYRIDFAVRYVDIFEGLEATDKADGTNKKPKRLFVILTLLAEFYDGQGSTSKSREFLKLGELQNIVSERLKAGLALEQEREQDGTNLYTEMYETVLDYKSMSEAYEALKSVEAGSRSKYTKEGYVSIICNFLDRQELIIFIPEDEMIKTTAKLDNIMEYKILNKENYARIMETLGETHE